MKLLKEGDVIELKAGHTVYANVPEWAAYSNGSTRSKRRVESEVEIGVPLERGFKTDQFAGRYLVVRAVEDGGSGPGSGQFYASYDDGHHVFCEKLSGRKTRVNFYQTGSFTAMIENIPVVSRFEKAWKKAA